mgnify:CR=1 FL=1
MDFQKTELTKTIWHQVFTGLIPYGLFLAAQWQVLAFGRIGEKFLGLRQGYYLYVHFPDYLLK